MKLSTIEDEILQSPFEPASSQTQPTGNSAPPEPTAATGDHKATQFQPPPELIHALASSLREMTGAAHLSEAVAKSLTDRIPGEAFKIYRDRLIQDSGNPTDPIEVMLIEQIAMAHFHIGRLYLRACHTDNHKLATAYADAATRLLAEFRRCTLALEDFREKQAARKDRAACIDAVNKPVPVESNGKSHHRASANGKKKAVGSQLRTTGEIPECIRRRMGYAVSGEVRSTVGIGNNGEG